MSQPTPQIRLLLDELAMQDRLPKDAVKHLDEAISSAPDLARFMSGAVESGDLQRIRFSPPDVKSGGHFDEVAKPRQSRPLKTWQRQPLISTRIANSEIERLRLRQLCSDAATGRLARVFMRLLLSSRRMFRFQALAIALLSAAALPACTGARMNPVYSRSMVEPISVEKRSETEIAIRYKIRPESSHYSGGVDYERVDDALRVVIGRCAVGESCEPMAKSVIPLDNQWQAEVHLPYDGSRIVVVHADGEAQIYP